ncbi:MAG: rRNA maturation RNase YbeY [Chloroflexota bacterium]
MITIESKYDFPTALIERAVNAALTQQKKSLDVNLSVVLTDNRRLRKLNRDYLGVDAPTDVLSFPASESDGSEIDPETGARYIGDILISVPYAAKGAKQAGNSLEAELQLLVVHGVLHLLGHDHAKPKEKSKMWKAQAEILESLGLGEVKIREE